MAPLFTIYESARADKRFVAIFEDGERVNFGQRDAQTFVDGASEAKKNAYLARHGAAGARENWEDIRTPGALSRWILWGDSRDLAENVRKLGGALG